MTSARLVGTKMQVYLSRYQKKIPGIRRLPFPVLAIISLLLLVNLFTWAVIGIVLVSLDLTSVQDPFLSLCHAHIRSRIIERT